MAGLRVPVPGASGARHLSTSIRTRALTDTLASATALMERLQIASCVDATPHDVLGVPVWFSTRPGGLAGTLHSGKGVHALEARVGALMEAIEFAVAERADARCGDERMSLGDVTRQFGPALTVADLAPRFGAAVPPERLVAVDACDDITSGAVHRLPAELLRLLTPAADADGPLFGTSSNGLASGNSLNEATLHGLLEVLERDCIALDLAKPSTRVLAASSLPDPFCAWSQRWSALGIQLDVRWLVNAFGLPCFAAAIGAAPTGPEGRWLGFGCHPHARVALARAVTEAAQCRLHALRFPKPGGPAGHVEPERVSTAAEMPFNAVPGLHCDSVDDALHQVLALLRTQGMPWVLRRRLNADADAADLDGLHVVKVVVPGCESVGGRSVRIGRRLALRLVQAA